jgi:hypothetical protein
MIQTAVRQHTGYRLSLAALIVLHQQQHQHLPTSVPKGNYLLIFCYFNGTCINLQYVYICVQLSGGFSKNNYPPKTKFVMERLLKMKMVCTWGFDLRVDIGKVTEITRNT